jgi:glycosyltransferase involved in cell wall biosynthesis
MKLLFVAQSPTPYWLHFIRRARSELAGTDVRTLFTHSVSNAPWALDVGTELNAVVLGVGGHSKNPLADVRRDLGVYHKVLAELHQDLRETVVLVGGYNDAGRLRLLQHCRVHDVPVLMFADSNARSERAAGIKRAVKQKLLHYVLERVTGLMVCGSLGRQFFLNYGADPRHIYYCPYEPDYDLIESLAPQTIASATEPFGLVENRRRLVYSGRLVPEKRVDLLVDAFASLAGNHLDWDLLIVGDGPLRAELAKRVPVELSARVRFLGFQGRQEVVSALYRRADLLCLPSAYEPWALVINEAACAGLAIVASDVVGAAAELVRDGVNGKTFVSGDLGSLQAALGFCMAGENIDRLKQGSRRVLADWRQAGDPIAGLRKAFADIHLRGEAS